MRVASIFLASATMVTYVLSMVKCTLGLYILCGLLAIAWAISELEVQNER